MIGLLNDKLTFLAGDRKQVQEQKDVVDQLESDLKQSDLYKKIQVERELLTKLSDITKVTDGEIRELALEVYAEKSNKQVCDGVTVGEYTLIDIQDEAAAVLWASEHHQAALRLDKREIKKVAKVLPVDGITVGKENRVRIAGDLSGYLEE